MKKLLGKIVCRIGANMAGGFIMEVPGIPDTRLGIRLFKTGLKMQGIDFNDLVYRFFGISNICNTPFHYIVCNLCEKAKSPRFL